MKKLIYLVVLMLPLIGLSGNDVGKESEKGATIEKMSPHLNIFVTVICSPLFINEPEESIKNFKTNTIPIMVSILKKALTQLPHGDLKSVSTYLSSQDYQKKRIWSEPALYLAKKALSYFVLKCTEKSYQKVSDSYFKAIKEYLVSREMDPKLSKLFDLATQKARPSLIKGLTQKQIEQKKLNYIKGAYQLIATEIASIQDEDSFRRCIEFEQSDSWKSFQEVSLAALEEVMVSPPE